jgi:hypothetical protein
VLAITTALVLTGVLALATSPVQASSVGQRIDTLEQELTRLKQEQTSTREQAIAAQKKIPLFIYRPGNGLTIAAANDAWELQFGNRLMVYWTFWTKGSDGTSIPKRGTTNGVLTIRRFRPYMNARLKDGFYDLRFKLNATSAGEFSAFDAEMYIHFENISPWLPYLGFGATPSAILNPNNNNLSSGRGPRSEPGAALMDSNQVGTGSPDRGVGFVWRKIPRLGPTRITFFNIWVGQDRVGTAGQFASNSSAPITRDGRSMTLGLGVKPFDKLGGSFGKVMKGLQLSWGVFYQESPRATSGFARWRSRTAQTRAQRIDLVRMGSAGTVRGFMITPGVEYKWKWITLNLAGEFNQARTCVVDGGGNCMDGPLIRSSGWQFIASFWLWSPKKGLLAGSHRDGGLMLAPMFGRVDWKINGGEELSNCGGCTSAHAVQSGIGLWYYIPGRFMNVGVVWDHWLCDNCNSDVARTVKGLSGGDSAAFDTITLISRFQF